MKTPNQSVQTTRWCCCPHELNTPRSEESSDDIFNCPLTIAVSPDGFL